MGAEHCLTKKAKIDDNISIELSISIPSGHLSCEWEPSLPQKLSRAAFGRYEEARNALLAEWAKETGKGVLLLATT